MKIKNIKNALKARVASLNLNPLGAAVTVPVAPQFDTVVTKAKSSATKNSGKIPSPQIPLIPAQISGISGDNVKVPEKITPHPIGEPSFTPTEKTKTPAEKPARKTATRKQKENPAPIVSADDIPFDNIEAIVAKHLKAGRDYDQLPTFLNYVDSGIVSGKFVEEIANAVKSIKSSEKARHDFMTLQMYLLEHEMEAEERGLAQGIERGRNEERETLAIKMLRKGKSFDEVHEFTDLPFERLEQLTKNNPTA